MAKTPDVKGRWFGGDRTIEQQLMGLERLWPELPGKSVLDVGCAEGSISIECLVNGAHPVLGVEIRGDAVRAARRSADDARLAPNRIAFREDDANAYEPGGQSDVVLLLAILHKLKDPTAAARRYAAAARELVVIRLPPLWAPCVKDERSGNVLHDTDRAMIDSGFAREHSGFDGPFDEWMGYYRRIKP